MPSLLERQVEALRESVEPNGRWDRLASGDVYQYPDSCVLCGIAVGDAESTCQVCPLCIAEGNCDKPSSTYRRWCRARCVATDQGVGGTWGFNAPPVVALAREMKALLVRLLGEYEARLAEEQAT